MFKSVEKEEFEQWLKGYPNELVRNVTTICEPAKVNYNDFKRAPYWPDSVVASYDAGPGMSLDQTPCNFKVLEDINAPVVSKIKPDTDKPLLDKNGVELFEGDVVEMVWGFGPPNTSGYGRSYGADGRCVKQETILIRDKGTTYEHWSFESCHNHVLGSDMILVHRKDESPT